MKIHSTLIAGAALAAIALVPVAPAAAGGGVRLNFGGPLEAFTALPHGGGAHHHHGHSHRAQKPSFAHKKAIAERKAAARRAKVAEARQLEAKRRKEAAERKLAAERKAAEIAKQKGIAVTKARADERRARLAAAKRTEVRPEIVKAEVAVVEKIEKAEKVDKIEKVEAIAVAEAAPVKVSTAAVGNTLIPVDAIESDKADGEILLKPIDVETGKDAGSEVAANQSDDGSAAEQKIFAPQTCKRFVPSAGLTITVPCGE